MRHRSTPPTRIPLVRRRRRSPLRRLRSSGTGFWLVAAALAVGAGVLVADAGRTADQARRSLGATTSVVVSAHPLEVGEVLADDDLHRLPAPVGLVPDDAVTDADDAAGRTVRADVGGNEILTHARLGPTGRSAPAALVPPDTRAVAIPTSLGAPELHEGDVVDLIAAGDSLEGRVEGVILARRAEVVDVGDEQVTVAVAATAAPEVVAALTSGAVAIALVNQD